jgi:hypothetical protein
MRCDTKRGVHCSSNRPRPESVLISPFAPPRTLGCFSPHAYAPLEKRGGAHSNDRNTQVGTRIDVPNIPQCFMMTNMLSQDECRQIVAAAETMGCASWRSQFCFFLFESGSAEFFFFSRKVLPRLVVVAVSNAVCPCDAHWSG